VPNPPHPARIPDRAARKLGPNEPPCRSEPAGDEGAAPPSKGPGNSVTERRSMMNRIFRWRNWPWRYGLARPALWLQKMLM
jgi:hypothetical protein